MYYTFLVLWLISFNNKSLNSFKDPSVFILLYINYKVENN